MCCMDNQDTLVVDARGALRAVLMDIGDVLIDLCKELEIEDIKIGVSQDYDTGDIEFKAKADGTKVLEIKANTEY